MFKFPTKIKYIISCILILSLAASSLALHNFASANNQNITENTNNDYASVNRDTFISVDTNGVLQIKRNKRDKEEIMGKKNSWTLFIYLCGSNLETQYQYASKDIKEMLSANFNSENINNLNIIIQTGGSKHWGISQIPNDKIGRYKIDGNTGNLTLLQELDNSSMGDADTLYNFLNWGIDNYAAEHMGVIFWDHGSGVSEGICIDEQYNNDSLSVHELEYSFAKLSKKMTSKFEMIGFDTCLSGSLEYANLLAPYSKYMVASADLEPGDGWVYRDPINFLLYHPDATGAELGREICNAYGNYYNNVYVSANQRVDYTIATYDLSKVDKACIETNYLAKYLYEILTNNDEEYWHLCKFRSSRLRYGYDNLDMGSILDYFDNSSRYNYNTTYFRQALNDLIIYSRLSDRYISKKANGITLYLPSSLVNLGELNTYRNVCFSPYWLKYIEWINTRIRTKDMSNFKAIPWEHSKFFFEENFDFMNYDGYNGSGKDINAVVNNVLSSNPKYYEDGFPDIWYSNVELDDDAPNNNFHPREVLKEMKINTENSTLSACIPSETKNEVRNVFSTIFANIDDSLVCLGQNNKVIYDKNSGSISSSFNGEWFMLPDGQLLTAYIVSQEDNSTIYSFPVSINDVESSIRIEEIYDGNNYTYYTLGIWDSNDNPNVYTKGGRSYLPLKPGTTISPIYDVFNLETNQYESEYGDKYTINNNFEFLFTQLNDGDYAFSYELKKYNELSAYSEIKNFTIKDNNINLK